MGSLGKEGPPDGTPVPGEAEGFLVTTARVGQPPRPGPEAAHDRIRRDARLPSANTEPREVLLCIFLKAQFH